MRDCHLRVSDPVTVEHGIEIRMSQFGRVTFAAEVGTENMVQIGVQESLGELGGTFIGKVAMPAHNALLEMPWSVRAIT